MEINCRSIHSPFGKGGMNLKGREIIDSHSLRVIIYGILRKPDTTLPSGVELFDL